MEKLAAINYFFRIRLGANFSPGKKYQWQHQRKPAGGPEKFLININRFQSCHIKLDSPDQLVRHTADTIDDETFFSFAGGGKFFFQFRFNDVAESF